MAAPEAPAPILDCGGRRVPLDRPRVMGVLNVTPDSFSDGGRYAALEQARARARAMVEEGADLIDVGGESSRPGAEQVSEAVELERVIPVIEAVAAEVDVPLSVDTYKPRVAREAVVAGAGMINDIRALQEPGAPEAAAELGVPVCLMHMQGRPRDMQQGPAYDDVVEDVAAFLDERMEAARSAGVPAERIVVDPGFGFGKTLAHNYRLLHRLERIAALVHDQRRLMPDILDPPARDHAVTVSRIEREFDGRGADIENEQSRAHSAAPLRPSPRLA